MNASFYMPTRVFFGENALTNNKSALACPGKTEAADFVRLRNEIT